MGFDWRDFLVLARELGQAPEESKKRTAVGRAYYFVYNAALTEAKRHGYNPYVPSSTGLHKRLWGWCQAHRDPDIVALGDAGSTLHVRRIRVDYQAATSMALPQDVRKQLAEAEECEARLAEIARKAPWVQRG